MLKQGEYSENIKIIGIGRLWSGCSPQWMVWKVEEKWRTGPASTLYYGGKRLRKVDREEVRCKLWGFQMETGRSSVNFLGRMGTEASWPEEISQELESELHTISR